MRVGFDARWYNDSGVGTYVGELLRALSLAQRGMELVVYQSSRNPVPGLNGNAIERVDLRTGKYSLLSQLELGRRCKQDRLDVFHSPFYPVPLAISCPVIVTFHDLIPFLFRNNNWPKQLLIKMGYRVAAVRSAHIITVSQQTARDAQNILRVSPDKVTVIHNAASAIEFHCNGDATEIRYLQEKYGIHLPYVVAASARNWRTKNLGSALLALVVARQRSGVEFQTVLYGPHKGMNALNIQDDLRELNILQLGYIPARVLGMLYRHARLFIMPSLYEGFGLPVVEAMACGCPVVTSNAGALAEVAGNGAQTFSPFDIDGMAEAITRLLQSTEDLKKWQDRAIKRAADFSWEKAAQETLAVYLQTIRRAAGKDS